MSEARTRRRLDYTLVERGLVPTRSRARDLILRGHVTVDGVLIQKPAATVATSAMLEVTAAADDVSRGAVKLRAALTAFGFDVTARTCLDVGASTGGFTQALIAAGADKVFAVDVGVGQLSAHLRADPRVINLESRDARGLTATDITTPVDAIVADVSFISLAKALPVPLGFAAPGAWLVALVKPQFEVGREGVGKGGIVRDAAKREAAVAAATSWIAAQPKWNVVGVANSPIAGGSGNTEYLLGARRDG